MSYAMWLAVVSVPFVVLERLVPRDASQGFWRPGLLRDFGFFVLNGHFVGVALAIASGWLWSFAQVRWGLPEGGLFSVQPVHVARCILLVASVYHAARRQRHAGCAGRRPGNSDWLAQPTAR